MSNDLEENRSVQKSQLSIAAGVTSEFLITAKELGLKICINTVNVLYSTYFATGELTGSKLYQLNTILPQRLAFQHISAAILFELPFT